MTLATDDQLWSNAAAGEGCGRWRSNGVSRGGVRGWRVGVGDQLHIMVAEDCLAAAVAVDVTAAGGWRGG
jgi:hypothetical protein